MRPTELLESGRVTITRAETARLLGLDVRTVSAAIERGEIPARRYGRRVLVLAHPLLEQLGVEPEPPAEPAAPPTEVGGAV